MTERNKTAKNFKSAGKKIFLTNQNFFSLRELTKTRYAFSLFHCLYHLSHLNYAFRIRI